MQLVSEPGKLQTPGGGYGFRFFDNDGRTVEVSADVAVRQHRKIEEGESIPVRLSHVVINSADPEAHRRVLREAPRLRALRHPDAPAHGRHDVVHADATPGTTASRSPAARTPSLHHASFEMRGIDEYMRGTGRLLRAGVEKVWGPGRHLAGNNTFSYFLDPHGNTIEYTTELEQLDEDTWHPHLYDFTDPRSADQWGTANPMNEFVAKQVVQRPRPGPLRQAPPV